MKYVGVSEMPIPTLRKAHALCPITAYQMEWSLFTRDVEDELVPTCRDLGIGKRLVLQSVLISMRCPPITLGIVAYSPLGRGLLTGVFKNKEDIPKGDLRLVLPRSNEHFDHNIKLVKIVEDIAAEKGCTPAQVALAWVHAQGEDVFPIPGTRRVSSFELNTAAFYVKLTEEDIFKLNGIADRIKGYRYPERAMAWTYGGL